MMIRKTGTAMTDEDLKAAMEAIRQANERVRQSPENARRFLDKIYSPTADKDDTE
ncbi:hypothetical protein [Azospirillum sp. SYSU D00513]|uniref:hypothetical protein n=1 Tax=Azospirillum sp. SYSU D00513 TaxID=2812561 RepID=UPI001A96B2EE|nr:hypothetical protein [Azospirillum sp. SYSU D00513]